MKGEVEGVLGENLEIDSLKILHVHVFLSQGFLTQSLRMWKTIASLFSVTSPGN